MTRRVYLHSAGSIGAQSHVEGDAAPGPLDAHCIEPAARLPRLASRFARLAVIGAQRCLGQLPTPLPPDCRIYAATGLGEVARTDALYYEVMPPAAQMASPARFATSGNNLAAFFVAQYAGISGRNITISQDTLSFEQALLLAVDDLRHGACRHALVGAIDECTRPRDHQVRRFPLVADQPIGEGSAWFVLGCEREGAIAEILQVRILAPHASNASAVLRTSESPERTWAAGIRHMLGEDFADPMPAVRNAIAQDPSCPPAPRSEPVLTDLLFGCRITVGDRIALENAMPSCRTLEYLSDTGVFPTAGALAIARHLQGADMTGAEHTRILVHVNRDDLRRTGLIAIGLRQRTLPKGSGAAP